MMNDVCGVISAKLHERYNYQNEKEDLDMCNILITWCIHNNNFLLPIKSLEIEALIKITGDGANGRRAENVQIYKISDQKGLKTK